jgi:SecD/SecF fusion protein
MLSVTSFLEDPLTVFATGLILMILFFWYFATEIERRKRNIGTVLLLGVCSLCILAATPLKERLRGGIDIVGGSSFSLRIQEREGDDGMKMPITKEQVEQAILVIEKRLNSMGTTEPLIARQGTDGILVQMPGVSPEESANVRATLEKVAKLELRESFSPRSDEPGPDGKSLAQRVQDGDESSNPATAPTRSKARTRMATNTPARFCSTAAWLSAARTSPAAFPSPQQADAVAITLNNDGTNKMIALTKNMRPGQDRIAIVLDGEVISAPVVNAVPLGKNFIIEGLREPGEVQGLANALMNPLETRWWSMRNAQSPPPSVPPSSSRASGLVCSAWPLPASSCWSITAPPESSRSSVSP